MTKTVGRPKPRIRLKAEALEAWLTMMGWTQHRFAIECGVSPSQMSDILSGKRRTGAKVVAAVMTATKTPFDFFFEVAKDEE